MDRLLGGSDFYTVIGQPLYDWLVGVGIPGWLVALVYAGAGAVATLLFITVFAMLAIWGERRFIARLQHRRGPNRVGHWGMMQTMADMVKMLGKEIITPSRADRFLHFISPMLVLGPSLMAWAVIPWGPGLQVTDVNVAVLYVIAFGSVPVLGILLAGWGSNNKYSLFGGMRSVVQFVSYEVPAAVTLVVPVLLAGTMSVRGIVEAQSGPFWNWTVFKPVFFLGPVPIPIPIIGGVAFLWYLIAGLAEVNRTPFDLVEADSELAAGYFTEYGGIQWGLFMLAEYTNSAVIALLAASFFLGGYQTGLGEAVDRALWPFLPGVLITKMALLFLVFVWVRGTMPRFRYDQLMQFAWTRMLPVALGLVALTAVLVPFLRVAPVAR